MNTQFVHVCEIFYKCNLFEKNIFSLEKSVGAGHVLRSKMKAVSNHRTLVAEIVC